MNYNNKELAEPVDHRVVYPCGVYRSGHVGGHYQIFAESASIRTEWKQKLEEVIGLRHQVDLENNKVQWRSPLASELFIYGLCTGIQNYDHQQRHLCRPQSAGPRHWSNLEWRTIHRKSDVFALG